MKALEFKSKIKNNLIQIPKKLQSQIKENQGKKIKVIVLIDESKEQEEILFEETTKEQFLEGYAESDSIYDNY